MASHFSASGSTFSSPIGGVQGENLEQICQFTRRIDQINSVRNYKSSKLSFGTAVFSVYDSGPHEMIRYVIVIDIFSYELALRIGVELRARRSN